MKVIDSLLAESVRAASHHGMEVSHGVLCLPAGLTPERVRLLTSALRGKPFEKSDPAMMWFMELAGVKRELRNFIDCFIDNGSLDFVKGFERLSWRQKLMIGILGFQALRVFDQMRDYLISQLPTLPNRIETLEDAVVALRGQVARRMDCDDDWNDILTPDRAALLHDLGREWSVPD